MSITVTTYRLRGGQLQPLAPCAGGQSAGAPDFYSQTFGADKITSVSSDSTTQLLASTDFQGQKGGDITDIGYIFSTYAKASYKGTGLRNTDGTLVYQSEEEFVAQFVNEEDIGA
jgi:hypothetical protein